ESESAGSMVQRVSIGSDLKLVTTEDRPASPEVAALAVLLRRRSGGSLLRGWRRYFDPAGAAQVRRQEFLQGCKEVGAPHLAKPIWQQLSLEGRRLAFSSLFPTEQARLDSFAALLLPAAGVDLGCVWERLDTQRKNRLQLQEFEAGMSTLGLKGSVKPLFEGIAQSPPHIFVFREDFLYLRLFLCRWLQGLPGGVDGTLADLLGHVRQNMVGPEDLLARLGLGEDEAVAVDEFAARLSPKKRRCLANRGTGTEVRARELASLLNAGDRRSPARPGRSPRSPSGDGPRSGSPPPRAPARAAWPPEAPPSGEGARGDVGRWDGGVRDLAVLNRGVHRSQRTYFDPHASAPSLLGCLEQDAPPVAQGAADDEVPLVAFPLAGRSAATCSQTSLGSAALQRSRTSLGPRCSAAQPEAPAVQRPAAPPSCPAPSQTSHTSPGPAALPGSPPPARGGPPRFRMLHFEATKLRGGLSGYRARIEALVFYFRGEPQEATVVSKVPYIVSFSRPTQVDEFRFRTENDDPRLDILQWHLSGSPDGSMWRDIHSQVEDRPGAASGRIVRQHLLGGEDHDMLRVYVVGASGLKNCATSKQRGTSDPYCTVWVDTKPGTKAHTEVVASSLSPEWRARLEVPCFQAGDDLRIMVRHSRFGASAKTSKEDVLLGQARLPSDSFLPHGFDGCVDLEQGAGRVRLHVRALREACISPVHRHATASDPLELWLCDTMVTC
ncbi:unnamed protein product, partial [Prorocentrum cordatum]